jgi:hypothetical protein
VAGVQDIKGASGEDKRDDYRTVDMAQKCSKIIEKDI